MPLNKYQSLVVQLLFNLLCKLLLGSISRAMIFLNLQRNLLCYIWKMRMEEQGKMLPCAAVNWFQILFLGSLVHSSALAGLTVLVGGGAVLLRRLWKNCLLQLWLMQMSLFVILFFLLIMEMEDLMIIWLRLIV
nr:hypothetical protein Iba_chr02bCG11400 [Ipomoea batatas]